MTITDKLTLTCEDNMEMMSRYPDNHFDIGIIDPPYGIGASKPSLKKKSIKQRSGNMIAVKQAKYTHSNWDDNTPSKEYFDELMRVTKNQIIFGVNYFNYPLTGGRIVWDKLNRQSDQFDCEIAYCSFNNRTDLFYYMWAGMMQGKTASRDITEAIIQQGNKKMNEKRIHSTQKPVQVYKYLLNKYAWEGDLILDTNLGSASLAIACHDYGFNLTGCEIDTKIYKDGIKRVQNHIKQIKLF